jgi:hypothetical protein
MATRVNRYAKYRQALRALRLECPVDLPVRVRLNHRTTDCYGWTTRTKGGLSITVCTQYNRRLKCNANELRDTLVHEWAHAMVSAPCEASEGHHDALWGVAYAKAYRAVVED